MKKTLVYIIAAIAAIAVAFVLFTWFVPQTQEKTQPVEATVESTPKPIEMVNVVIADRYIAAGAEITADMLRTTTVPITEKPTYAISNAYDAVGSTAIMAIPEDTTVLSVMLEQPHTYIADSQGLSYEIPEGFVGLAIPATGLEAVAGYLIPGDVINILAYAKPIKAAMEGIPAVEGDVIPVSLSYLVKNVTIIAVGDKAYDEVMAYNASLVQPGSQAPIVTTVDEEGNETKSTMSYTCIIIALDDITAQLVAETMQWSTFMFTLQHRDYGAHEVTTPELVPVSQDFIYTTEADVKSN